MGQALISTSGTISYMFAPTKNYDFTNTTKFIKEDVVFQDSPKKTVPVHFTTMRLGTFYANETNVKLDDFTLFSFEMKIGIIAKEY